MNDKIKPGEGKPKLRTAVVVFDEEGAGYVSGIIGAGMDVDWHMCQEHINDACMEDVPGAAKWVAVRMREIDEDEITAAELLAMWNVITRNMFKAEHLPPRGDKGYTWHPDLDFFFRKFTGVEDEGQAAAAFLECLGIEFASIFMNGDISSEGFQADQDVKLTADVSQWKPDWPEGKNWLQVAITDSDQGPVAIYVRLPGATS